MVKEIKEYLTSDKKIELENELNQLKTVKRKEIADAIEWAKSLGDLAENAEYSQAREDQAKCEARIGEIENILQNAVITDSHSNGSKGITVGCAVIVKKVDENFEQTFVIVGSEEVNLEEGKISNESPLGNALLGKDVGDTVTFMTPKGQASYTIINIEK